MRKSRHVKISLKIILWISVILILCMALVNTIIYYFAYNRMLTMNKNSMKIISDQIYENFQNLITIQTNDIDKISLDNDVIKLINDKNALKDNNSEAYKNQRASLNSKLKLYSVNNNTDEHIFVTDKNGVIISDSTDDYLNNDLSNYDFMQKALHGQNNMSEVYNSVISAKPIVTFVKPIKDNSGNVIGTVGKSVFTDYFSQKFNNFKFLNNGYIFVVDSNKNVIYDPVKYNINKKTTIKEVANLMNNKNLFTNMQNGDLTYKSKGINYTAYYTSIPELKSLLVLTVNQNEIKRDPAFIGGIIAFLAFLMLLIMIPTINIVINNILKPMKKLIRNTEEISKGNLTVKNEIEASDEIGDLSLSFNNMTDSINELLSDVKTVIGDLVNINSTINSSQISVNQGMDKISHVSTKLSNDTDKVKEAVEWCLSSFSNIVSRIEKIKNQSDEMSQDANNIKETNEKGIKTVENLSNISKEVVNTVNRVNESFMLLSNNLDDIMNITKLVTTVSKQTHILSLNASIEAARVGEHGAGFKIVANQIKTLSENITEQMSKIDVIVQSISSNLNNTKVSIQVVNNTAASQFDAVGNTIESFGEIMKTTENILSKINEVNVGIELLNKENTNVIEALNSMNAITKDFYGSINGVNDIVLEQNGCTQEMGALVDVLQSTTDRLSNKINKFTV